MREKVIASNKWSKTISGEEYGETKPLLLEVEAELGKIGGNTFPYYSITGSVKKTDKRYRDPIITCGAIHDIILRHFPHLAPLVEVHLSAPDGQPIHAEGNARYWAGLSKWNNGQAMSPRDRYGRIEIETDKNGVEWSPKTLASHLQCDEKTAREVRGAMVRGLAWDYITRHAGLIDLWSEQAGKARALLVSRERVGA
jgi:hypothetical protein